MLCLDNNNETLFHSILRTLNMNVDEGTGR